MAFKILVLLYASLFTYIFPVLSLDITIPTQFHPRVNDTASVLLNWSSEDPSHFWIAIRRSTPPDMNFTTSIQPVESFIETRNVSVVFRYAGTTFIEAFETSSTEVGSNVTLASSVLFQVDEAPTTGSGIASHSTRSTSSVSGSATLTSAVSSTTFPVSESAMVTSAPVPPTATKTSASSPSKHNYTAMIIAVICSAILLVLIAASVLIWRHRKRWNIPRRSAFPTSFDDERQRAPSMRSFLNNIDGDEREHTASPSDHLLDVPPPPYSPF
ncbi:uncharacterized protein ARMOST_20625 [Armillaria ostoyae]|uniref:Uncharacterized protein n=1 Tax=Armillaria ostoyae TaxID=47428 RepID=A0A284S7W7_ARMOS|nr:uncharacterized protein ARMOST_20625 [Armillaria ostoyae]